MLSRQPHGSRCLEIVFERFRSRWLHHSCQDPEMEEFEILSDTIGCQEQILFQAFLFGTACFCDPSILKRTKNEEQHSHDAKAEPTASLNHHIHPKANVSWTFQ